MKLLITGFDPFEGATINPAFEAVKLLPEKIAGAEVIKLEIPTVFGVGPAKVIEAIEKHDPDFVICVGQAGDRATITPEFVAINYMDARIPDNSGSQPKDKCIKEDGENAYFTKLPVKAIVTAMREAGIPASVSYTAGTFVCNNVMYELLYYINKNHSKIKGGFIHVPYATVQAVNMPDTTPSLPISMLSDGLRISAEVLINNN